MHSYNSYTHTLSYVQKLIGLWFPKKHPWNNTSSEIACSFLWDTWACWHRVSAHRPDQNTGMGRLIYFPVREIGIYSLFFNRWYSLKHCSCLHQSIFYCSLTWPAVFRGYPKKRMNTQKIKPQSKRQLPLLQSILLLQIVLSYRKHKAKPLEALLLIARVTLLSAPCFTSLFELPWRLHTKINPN